MVFKQIDKKLRANGWYKVRRNGSHNIYRHDGSQLSISVPDHGKESISTGVIKSLERATGLSFR